MRSRRRIERGCGAFAGLVLAVVWSVPAAAQKDSGRQFAFEVLSIRPHKASTEMIPTQYLPDGYKATLTLQRALMLAYLPLPYYQWSASKIDHAPTWLADELYDVDARVAPEDVGAWQRAQDGRDSELLHAALRTALAERCKLVLHVRPVEVPYLNLMVDSRGARRWSSLHATVPGAIKPIGGKSYAMSAGFYIEDDGKRQFVGVTMKAFAGVVGRLSLDLPVQDMTGLTGRYDFALPWYGYEQHPASEIADPLERMPVGSAGLVLRRGRGPGFVIDIDHMERPDSN